MGLVLSTFSGNYCSVSIIALRYLPLGVLPSWSRSVCNITFVLSLEFASSSQTLGNFMEQIPHKSLIGNCKIFLCLARTGTAYTATSSPATRTVWTPSSPSLTTWWSQGVRMAMEGLSIFIHTGLSYAVLLFIWWEINHLIHKDLQTEIIWLNVLIPIFNCTL